MWSVHSQSLINALALPVSPVLFGTMSHWAHLRRCTCYHFMDWAMMRRECATNCGGRTSTYCFWFLVHCRRRKIRCLVAPDDSQGRCENCIRLRKECQFFPVDQQPPIEKKSRPTSRLETQPPADHSTTITSSPTNVKYDSAEPYYPYPQIPLNASSGQDISAFNPAVYASHPMSGFAPGRLALILVGFGLLLAARMRGAEGNN